MTTFDTDGNIYTQAHFRYETDITSLSEALDMLYDSMSRPPEMTEEEVDKMCDELYEREKER